jgi:hypothetical protein
MQIMLYLSRPMTVAVSEKATFILDLTNSKENNGNGSYKILSVPAIFANDILDEKRSFLLTIWYTAEGSGSEYVIANRVFDHKDHYKPRDITGNDYGRFPTGRCIDMIEAVSPIVLHWGENGGAIAKPKKYLKFAARQLSGEALPDDKFQTLVNFAYWPEK